MGSCVDVSGVSFLVFLSLASRDFALLEPVSESFQLPGSDVNYYPDFFSVNKNYGMLHELF